MYNFSKDPPIQDYDLWSRIAKKFSVGNIQELLVIYREVKSGMSRSEKKFGEVVAKQSMENIWSLSERDKQNLESTELEYLSVLQ